MSALTAPERALLTWESVLDRLELDVVRLERALEADGVVDGLSWWEPQAPAEPLPAELLPRAQRLQARQQEAQRRLAETLEGIRAQQAFTGKVERAAGRPAAVARFVDVSA